MFKPGTILELKEPREPSQKLDPYTEEPVFEKKRNPRTGEVTETDKPVMLDFPYNRVKVIGSSPISYAGRDEYKGADAQGVIIEPIAAFGGNLDEPMGKIKQLYKVVSIPEDIVPAERTIRVVDAATNQAGETPEEVFAREAPGKVPAPGLKRGRTSPFDGIKPPKGSQGTSPL